MYVCHIILKDFLMQTKKTNTTNDIFICICTYIIYIIAIYEFLQKYFRRFIIRIYKYIELCPLYIVFHIELLMEIRYVPIYSLSY